MSDLEFETGTLSDKPVGFLSTVEDNSEWLVSEAFIEDVKHWR